MKTSRLGAKPQTNKQCKSQTLKVRINFFLQNSSEEGYITEFSMEAKCPRLLFEYEITKSSTSLLVLKTSGLTFSTVSCCNRHETQRADLGLQSLTRHHLSFPLHPHLSPPHHASHSANIASASGPLHLLCPVSTFQQGF